MKAIVTTPGEENSVRLIDAPIPKIEDEVLLKVCEVGVDGTDMEINKGLYGSPPEWCSYLVVGHECLARVERVEGGITGFGKGDLVVLTVRRPDHWSQLERGESEMCSEGGAGIP